MMIHEMQTEEKKDILAEIAKRTRERIAEEKKKVSLEEMKMRAEQMPSDFSFPMEKALKAPGISLICEVKKASPSKGLIAEDFPYLAIAKDYDAYGAAAISCLTEPYYFQGSDSYLMDICKEVSIPVLRKDFTVDPYMIYQAKCFGASAVLLICAILTEKKLKEYLDLAHSLSLSAIVEAHTKEEVLCAVRCGARIIGVNNRNLKNFTVDLETSISLRKYIPEDIIFVSESGIRTGDDVKRLYQSGADAVLIGETLMRQEDKKTAIKVLREGCE